MLGLSVDENPLKLQLLLELLDIGQLHIRAGWAEILFQFEIIYGCATCLVET